MGLFISRNISKKTDGGVLNAEEIKQVINIVKTEMGIKLPQSLPLLPEHIIYQGRKKMNSSTIIDCQYLFYWMETCTDMSEQNISNFLEILTRDFLIYRTFTLIDGNYFYNPYNILDGIDLTIRNKILECYFENARTKLNKFNLQTKMLDPCILTIEENTYMFLDCITTIYGSTFKIIHLLPSLKKYELMENIELVIDLNKLPKITIWFSGNCDFFNPIDKKSQLFLTKIVKNTLLSRKEIDDFLKYFTSNILCFKFYFNDNDYSILTNILVNINPIIRDRIINEYLQSIFDVKYKLSYGENTVCFMKHFSYFYGNNLVFLQRS